MRQIALILAGIGFVAFTASARAEETNTENTQKTETSKTLTGKKKIVKSKKMVDADGTTTETKTETTSPKRDADAKPVRADEGSNESSVKTEKSTTLTGKEKIKTTKKLERPDGTTVERTSTTTEPEKK